MCIRDSNQGECAESLESGTNLPEMVVVTLIVAGELDARRSGDQQIEKEWLAMGIGQRCFEPGFFCTVLDIEDVEIDRCGVGATVLDLSLIHI